MKQQQDTFWKQGRFSITPVGLSVTGKPSASEWAEALSQVSRVRSGTQWAIGDMLVYAEGRAWDDEEVMAALDDTGLKLGTLQNLKSVAKRFPRERRNAHLPWSHHALVASLGADEAGELLAQSATQQWGWEEMRVQARSRRQEQRRLAQPWPEGTYGLLLAVPTWRRQNMVEPGALSGDAIAALAPDVQRITGPDAVLYLATPPDQPEAGLSVVRGWGFRLVATHVLVATASVSTAWQRERHELVLVGARGAPEPPRDGWLPDSVVDTSSVGRRDVLLGLARSYPSVPRVRLFSTDEAEGWAAWGYTLEEAPSRDVVLREPERAVATA